MEHSLAKFALSAAMLVSMAAGAEALPAPRAAPLSIDSGARLVQAQRRPVVRTPSQTVIPQQQPMRQPAAPSQPNPPRSTAAPSTVNR